MEKDVEKSVPQTPQTDLQYASLACAPTPGLHASLTCAPEFELHASLTCAPEAEHQQQSSDSENQSGIPISMTNSQSTAAVQIQPLSQGKVLAQKQDPFPEFYPRGFVPSLVPPPEEAMSRIIEDAKSVRSADVPSGRPHAIKTRDGESNGIARRRKLSARRQAYAASPTRNKPRTAMEEQWARVESNLKRMELNKRSPFVPHTFAEYVAHVNSCQEAARRRDLRKLKAAERAALDEKNGIKPVPIGPAFGGKRFNDGRSAVLALPSIWTMPFESTLPRCEAPWPSKEEMKEEGDERNTSGFRRFVPLPRIPDTESVVWKQRRVLQQLSFDQVWPLPSAASVAAAQVKESAEEMARMEEMLGSSLMAALNCEDEDD